MKDLAGDDSSFTFKVNALPVTSDGEPGKNWSPFPDVEKCKVILLRVYFGMPCPHISSFRKDNK